MGKYFVDMAWLVTLDEELSEIDFIMEAGGIKKLRKFKQYPFVSLVLDEDNKGLIVGHIDSRTIYISMWDKGHKAFQTMEWK